MHPVGPHIESDLLDFERQVFSRQDAKIPVMDPTLRRDSWGGPIIFRDDPMRALLKLRTRLIREEFEELMEALETGSLVGIAKEGCDLIYVVMGTFVRLGIPFLPVWRMVHSHNMLKRGDALDADGKAPKPKHATPPESALRQLAWSWLRRSR